MNTNIINALRKYINDTASVLSFNQLVVKAAMQYLGTTTFTSFNDLVRRAANQYASTTKASTNDAVLAALRLYTGNAGSSLNSLMTEAAIKYNTAPVVPLPVNTVAPVVSGTPSVGQTLTTTNGTWTGSPTGYTYQWRRDGVAISGATSATYTVQAGDVGTTLTCTVTAINAGGSATAVSNGVAISAAKSYADFEAHITSLAANGALAWTGVAPDAGTYTTTAGAFSSAEVFYGTSWNGWFRRSLVNGNASMIVRHGAPSQAEADNQTARGRKIFLQISTGTAPAYNALLRNGYQSTAGGTALTAAGKLDRMLMWIGDDTTGSAVEMQPSLGLGPEPYTW